MAALVNCVLAGVALAIAPGLLFFFDITPKVVVLVLGSAAVLLICAFQKRFPAADVPLTFTVLLGAFWTSALISTVLSVRPDLSFSGSNWRRMGLVSWTGLLAFTWFVTVWLRSRDVNLSSVLRSLAVCGLPVAAYGILQYSGWDPWLPADAYLVGEDSWTIVRPPSTLGYVTYFAAYLLNVVGAGVALWLTEARMTWRVLGMFSASVSVMAIVLSGTRAAMLGLAIAGAFLAIAVRPKFQIRRIIAGLLVAFALVTAFYFSDSGQRMRARTRWYVEDPAGGPRLWLWRDSLNMAAAHPASGYGLETFPTVFPGFQSEALAKRFPDFAYESPHNIFLGAFAAQGAIGLSIFLALLVWTIWYATAAAPPNLSRVLLALLLASLIHHQFACFSLPTALFFFINLAMIVSLPARRAYPVKVGSPPGRLVRAILAVPASAVLIGFALQLLAADRNAETVRKLLASAKVEETIRAYSQVAQWQPPGMNLDLWYSRSMTNAAMAAPEIRLRIRAGQEAYLAARRATRSSEEPQQAWYHLAALEAMAGNEYQTEANLRAAIENAPNWYKPHWILAQLLVAQKRHSEAETEAVRAIELGGGKHPGVVRTLDEIRSLRSTR